MELGEGTRFSDYFFSHFKPHVKIYLTPIPELLPNSVGPIILCHQNVAKPCIEQFLLQHVIILSDTYHTTMYFNVFRQNS